MSSPTSAVSEADFAYVQRLIREFAGFVLEEDKRYLVETRLAPMVSRQGLASVEELVTRLRSKPIDELHRATVEALLNGETTFFRDVFCFNSLREIILPSLIESRRGERRLDIWCAACSMGQEPYSVSMLLAESFPELASWDVRILATDVSGVHLDRAKAGRYSKFEVNRGLPAALLVKYFDQQGNDWILEDPVRKRVEFREVNLVKPWNLPRMDLVLLRNVMIYWDVETKRQVLGRIRETLRPDGCLVLGGAETTYYIDPNFDRFDSKASCCFRVIPTP